jgi:hypothetical protein
LNWLAQGFPIPVALYGVTKYEADGSTTGTKQMTLANMRVEVGQTVVLRWDGGVTMPCAQLPRPVAVNAGSIAIAASDVVTLRKIDVQWPLLDPVTHTSSLKDRPVYAFYVQEGDGLLVIEIMDLKESLDGEHVSFPVARA